MNDGRNIYVDRLETLVESKGGGIQWRSDLAL